MDNRERALNAALERIFSEGSSQSSPKLRERDFAGKAFEAGWEARAAIEGEPQSAIAHNLEVFLSQKCIWDEGKQDWVRPNERTLGNLMEYVGRWQQMLRAERVLEAPPRHPEADLRLKLCALCNGEARAAIEGEPRLTGFCNGRTSLCKDERCPICSGVRAERVLEVPPREAAAPQPTLSEGELRGHELAKEIIRINKYAEKYPITKAEGWYVLVELAGNELVDVLAAGQGKV